MQRREFIKKASFGLAASGAATIPALSWGQMPSIKWQLASSFPKSLDTMYGAAEFLTKRISELTEGKFEIKMLAGEYSVPIAEFLDLVQKNTVQCIHTCSYYFHGKNKAFSIDTAIPFLLNALQMNAWYYQGQGLTLTHEVYAKFNVINFPGGNTGTQMGGWFRKEIKSLEDLKGLRIRIGGFGAEIFSALGAIPTAIRPGDIYSSLGEGKLDAAEWVGPYDDENFSFNKVAKFYYYPGWWEPGPQISFLINKEQWEKLPKPYQVAFEMAACEVGARMLAAYDAKNPLALQRLVQNGAELRRFPDDLIKAAYDTAQKIYADESAKNPDFKKLYDSLKSFQQLSDKWLSLAEGTMENFMSAQLQTKSK